MKEIKPAIYLFITALFLFCGGEVAGQTTSEYTARIIKKPTAPSLVITKNNDIEFGSIIPSATSGSVTINPDTDVVTSSNVTLLTSGAIRKSASFNISGGANQSLTFVFPATIQLSAPGVSPKMTYDLTKNNITKLNQSGTATLKIGGTLSVGANQPPGSYTGTFQVTVNYN